MFYNNIFVIILKLVGYKVQESFSCHYHLFDEKEVKKVDIQCKMYNAPCNPKIGRHYILYQMFVLLVIILSSK